MCLVVFLYFIVSYIIRLVLFSKDLVELHRQNTFVRSGFFPFLWGIPLCHGFPYFCLIYVKSPDGCSDFLFVIFFVTNSVSFVFNYGHGPSASHIVSCLLCSD